MASAPTAHNTDFELSFGECRFCCKDGYHRDLAKEYFWDGATEVYSYIINECFNLSIHIDNKTNKLICSSCTLRLRDAKDFRDTVVNAEQRLRDPLRYTLEEYISVEDVHMLEHVKKEGVKQELEDHDNDFDYEAVLDSSFCGQNNGSKAEGLSLVPGEAALLNRFKLSTLQLPTASPSFLRLCRALRGKIITAKDIELLMNQQNLKEKLGEVRKKPFLSEKRALIMNIATMLENTNITPFRSKTAQGYPCFYCRQYYDNVRTLRMHHQSEHKRDTPQNALWKHGPESVVVYVDITDLQCKLCDQAVAKLKDMRTHLTQKHDVVIHSKYTDRIVPFKIPNTPEESFECQICESKYETFGSIERHMNVHFRNYVCKDCGTGFVTKYRLKVHTRCMHTVGTYACQTCKKVFPSLAKLRSHEDYVHRLVKRFKCPQCGARFTEYFARQKHLVEAHGAEPLRYKCNVCDKVFDRRYTLSKHLKKDHLEERDFQCELCAYSCFTRSELRVHMIRHVGERVHECSVCRKAYARKKTLREHMRIHNNERRFVCNACGQAFVQKCSLKGHVKTHHPDMRAE